jgi:ribosomal protein S6
MNENSKDRLTVYEVGYLIGSSIPEEKVAEEVEKIHEIINDAGSAIVSEEFPRPLDLAYTIRKKTVAGSYDKFDKAYFGWIKFEVGTDKIESIKKSIEVIPSIIRTLNITTVKENTYLGKHSSSIAKIPSEVEKATEVGNQADVVESVPASPEEIDKSIDAMVKEA